VFENAALEDCGQSSVWHAPSARAEDSNTDIARLTMGSPVLPDGSWVIELTPIYTMHVWKDPAADTLQPIVSVAHAFTERLSLAVSYEGLDVARTLFKPAEVNVEARYLVLDVPFMLAPYLLVGIPFPNQPASLLVGAQALKNLGSFSLQGIAEGESFQTIGGLGFKGDLVGGAYYRFGINGIVGTAVEYQTDQGLSLNPLIGGRVSSNMFLAVQPSIGLTHGAPALQMLLQLTFYFGPFRAVGLD
jgi:hypothetical protein